MSSRCLSELVGNDATSCRDRQTIVRGLLTYSVIYYGQLSTSNHQCYFINLTEKGNVCSINKTSTYRVGCFA